jgi:hypothetical protein
MMIIYCIITLNAYYNYTINALYNYNISNKGLLEECDKEEHVDVTRAATVSSLKRKTVKRFVQCHVFAQSPQGWHPR